jgi:hypothetical protein
MIKTATVKYRANFVEILFTEYLHPHHNHIVPELFEEFVQFLICGCSKHVIPITSF